MKAAGTTLKIPAPCLQSWEEMERIGHNRLCGSCNKMVIDFSGHTHAEIIQLISKASTAVCGRINKTQLHQPTCQLLAVKDQRSWLKYAGMIVLGTSFFLSSPDATARSPLQVQQSIASPLQQQTPKLVDKINGYVLDEDRKPLAGIPITITIATTKYKLLTDKNGRYEMGVDQRNKSKLITLKVATGQYGGQLVVDLKKEKQQDLYVKNIYPIMGEIVIISPLRDKQKY